MRENYWPRLSDFYFGGLKRYEERNQDLIENLDWRTEGFRDLLGLWTGVYSLGFPMAIVYFTVKGIEHLVK